VTHILRETRQTTETEIGKANHLSALSAHASGVSRAVRRGKAEGYVCLGSRTKNTLRKETPKSMSTRRTKQQDGYIFRKGDFWFLRYNDNVMQPDGSIKRKQLCTKLAEMCDRYRNKKAVKPLAQEFLAPINSGKVDAMSTMPISTFIDTVFLPQIKEEKRPSTYRNYKAIFRLHLKARLGDHDLRSFRTVDAQRLLKEVARQSLTKTKLPLAHSTLERIKSFLSGVFKVAKRAGAFDGEIPVRDTSVSGGSPARETYAYNLDEVKQILSVLDEPARTVVLTASHTGFRKGELAGLQWGDFDGKSLTVARAKWNGLTLLPKTAASKAPVPCTPQLAAALERRRESMGAWGGDGFPIFQSITHTPLNLANLVTREIVPALSRCKVCRKPESAHKPEAHIFQRDETLPKWQGWHAFRRGLATTLHQLAVPDRDVQAILRHSNIQVTQKSYIKSVSEVQVNAMNMLSAEVGKDEPCNDHATNAKRPVN
jgi:integrase